jgi:hypothetical protein
MEKQILIDYLNKYDVGYWIEGKNVSKDSINIKCPFCDDHSNHLGIFYNDDKYSCWKCRTKGTISYLFSRLFGLTKNECDELIKSNTVSFKESAVSIIENMIKSTQSIDISIPTEVGLPEYFEVINKTIKCDLLQSYLKRRKLSIDTLIEHDCGICRVGDYMNRLIIPVVFKGRIVSFQAADMTGKAKVKYKTANNEINQYLYNYDNVYNEMIITEGILDCWAVKDGAVASFGTHITDRQKELILNKNLKRLIFCWDGDAYWKAREEAEYFKPFIDNVITVCLPKYEDPHSLGYDGVWDYISETCI